jgi:cyanophycinase
VCVPDAGPLLAIGGHEDREGERVILRRIAQLLAGAPLAVVPLASQKPADYVAMYRDAFADLPVEVRTLDGPADLERVGGAFLTGGSQLRLMQGLRRTRLLEPLRERWRAGLLVAGTSAGASALARHMIVRGPGRSSPGASELRIENGIGLVDGVIIDQHFAQRGRSGRLRAAVALDPGRIGVGIDEDTAVELRDGRATILGSGAVTLIDARGADVVAGSGERPPTFRGASFDILAAGDEFAFPAHFPVDSGP